MTAQPVDGALSEPTSTDATAHRRPLPGSIHSRYALELLIVFGAYFLGGRIGLSIPFTSGNVSPVWPSAGIAVAALLLVGYRVWPAIAAGAFLVNFLTPIAPFAALALSAGNTAGPVVGASLVRRIPGFRPSLTRLQDVLGLMVVAAPAGAALSATVGVTVLFITHVDPWFRFWPAWLVWWFGDVIGVFIVTPLALTLFNGRRLNDLRRVPELIVLVTAVIVSGLIMFDSRMVGIGAQKDVLAFTMLPLVLWAATRFEIRGAAGITLLTACLAVWETRSGSGPFVRNSALQNAIMLQVFLAVIAVSGLMLAAAIVERAQLIRLQAQREGIEQAERRYREIVETANDGIWMLDAGLVTVFVNRRMAEMLGYTVEEMSGKPLRHFVRESAWEQKQADVQRPGPMREHTETQYVRKDGSELWASVSRTRAFGDDGTFTGVLKMVNDITNQKRAEGERQQALDRVALLSKAVEETTDTVLISDGEGRIEYVNAAFEATTGYTREDALGQSMRLLESLTHVDQRLWERLLAGEPYRDTLINRKKSGELYWVNQTITPIRDATGSLAHFVAVLNDVTEARKHHERDVKLGLARAVQERLCPTSPCLSGFDIAAASYPADETGGDYFDFIEAPDGVLYVAIGDVSGHGFDAALIMALARAYIRSFAILGMDVKDVLARANGAIIGDLEVDRYVTMLLVRLDVRAGSLAYASAGHPPGFVLDRSNQIDFLMDSTGLPLGLFPDSIFTAREFQLKAGHIVVLGTDGATEACDAEGIEFGSTGVIEYVRAHANHTAREIAVGIYETARCFGGVEPPHDDITSVIVKVTDAAVFAEQRAPVRMMAT